MIQDTDEKVVMTSIDDKRLKIAKEIMRYMSILWSKLTEVQRSNPGNPYSELYGPYDSIKISFKTKDRNDESVYIYFPDDIWIHRDWTVSANEAAWTGVIMDRIIKRLEKHHYNLEDFRSIKSMLLWRQNPPKSNVEKMANTISSATEGMMFTSNVLELLNRLGLDQADLHEGCIPKANDSFHYNNDPE